MKKTHLLQTIGLIESCGISYGLGLINDKNLFGCICHTCASCVYRCSSLPVDQNAKKMKTQYSHVLLFTTLNRRVLEVTPVWSFREIMDTYQWVEGGILRELLKKTCVSELHPQLWLMHRWLILFEKSIKFRFQLKIHQVYKFRYETMKTLLESIFFIHSQTIGFHWQNLRAATRTSKVMCHLLKHSNFEGGASYVTLHGDAWALLLDDDQLFWSHRFWIASSICDDHQSCEDTCWYVEWWRSVDGAVARHPMGLHSFMISVDEIHSLHALSHWMPSWCWKYVRQLHCFTNLHIKKNVLDCQYNQNIV